MKVPRLVPDWPAGERVPPAGDPSWPRWAEPLLTEIRLHGPRSWAELRSWARAAGCSSSLLQNLLAWLSLDGWIDWDVTGRRWSDRTPQERAWYLRERARLELSGGGIAFGGGGSDDDI